MPAPVDLFALVRNATGAGDFRDAFQGGRASYWPQLKQCRAFYIGGFTEVADNGPVVDAGMLYGVRDTAKRLLGTWERQLASEWRTPSRDQATYALRSQPLTLDNACLQIRALEAAKKRRSCTSDIYQNLWIEPCIWSLTDLGDNGKNLDHIPQEYRDRFWSESQTILQETMPQVRSLIETQIAAGHSLPYDLANLAAKIFREFNKQIAVTVDERRQGNRKSACKHLRFLSTRRDQNVPSVQPAAHTVEMAQRSLKARQ